MSSTRFSQIRTKTSQNANKRSVSSLQKYLLLFKLITDYTNSFEHPSESSSIEKEFAENRDERIKRITAIINFSDRLRNEQVTLEECDKNQCLIQSLHIIKKLNRIANKNQIETRSKRRSSRKEHQAIQQLQRAAMQKVAQFLLTCLYPKKKSLRVVISFISNIIGELYQYQPNKEERGIDKQKTRKPLKKINVQSSSIECFLQNGSKISLVCFLVFKILQKNLQDFDQIKAQQDRDAKANIRDQATTQYLLDKHIYQYISEVINKVFIQQFQELNLLKLFLSSAVQHIHQMQLPIIPFFLNVFNNIMQTKFKTYYLVTFDQDQQQKINPRDVFSLQNLNILIQLADLFSCQLVCLQSSKQSFITDAICSYCGLIRQNVMERIDYQKISLKLNQNHNLAITICEDCCKHLNVVPASQMNLRLLGPLILSQFWNSQYDRISTNKVKAAISNFIRLHPAGQNCFQSDENFQKIFIAEKIAMNNVEQSISRTIIQKIYNTFVFFHSQLSIKSILIQVVQILTICWNSKDQKTREKSIKLLFKSTILQFLYNQQLLSIPEYAQQLKQTADHIIKGLSHRFKDSCRAVSLASLQFIIKIYCKNKVENEIFDELFAYLVQSNNKDFQIQALDVLEKLFCRSKNKKAKESSDIIKYILLNVKMLKFCLECLRVDSQLFAALKEKASKIISLILNQVSCIFQSRYSQSTQAKLVSIFEQFFSDLGFKLKIDQPLQITNQITLILLSNVKLDGSIVKNLPILSSQTIAQLLQLEKTYQIAEQTVQLIFHNILFIIKQVYYEVFLIKQQIFGKKRKDPVSNKNNLSVLVNYIHSSVFFQLLLQQQLKSQSKRQKYKFQILNQLLYLNNFNQVFSSQKQILKYFSVLQKNKKKSTSELQTLLSRIIIKKNVEESLEKLAMRLLQSIKSAEITQIALEVSLIVNIKWYLGKSEEIKGFIQIYERYCLKFYTSLNADLESYNSCLQESECKKIQSKFIALARCFHISTFLVTSLQEYLIGQQKVRQFYGSKSYLLGLQKANGVSIQKQNNSLQIVTSSLAFKNLYVLIINVLQASDEIIRDDEYIMQVYRKIFLLLRLYFEVNPKIIFMEPKLLKVLNKINSNDQEGFIIIKQMYKLFESLLPSNNLELLTLIRDQFSKRFHHIIRSQYGKKDLEFIEIAFSIIYHLLRSGMEGLYAYNKYLYLGLLHSSQKINQLTEKLIRQMYSDQASEKILYLNLSQSFQFVYDIFFNNQESAFFSQIRLTEQQRRNLSMLCEFGRFVNGQVILRNKKQIKISSSFIKKVGEFLSSNPSLIKERPLFITFILKMLKCQRMVDFSELCQTIYCLSRLTTSHQHQVEKLIITLKQTSIEENTQDKVTQSHIILAYRQLASCLAYFTKYKQAGYQAKNYQKLLENNFTPFTTLQEEFENTKLSNNDSFITKITKIEEDIIVLIDIVIGGVEYLQKRDESQIQEHSGSCQTQKTKVKGKAVNKKKRKNNPNHRPKSVEQSIQEQQSETQIIEDYRKRLRKQTRKPLNQDLLLQS